MNHTTKGSKNRSLTVQIVVEGRRLDMELDTVGKDLPTTMTKWKEIGWETDTNEMIPLLGKLAVKVKSGRENEELPYRSWW